MTGSRRTRWIVGVGVVIAAVVLGPMALGGPGTPVTIEIPTGATLPRVADLLEEEGVIGTA
ncbi:MAG: endolytic transglycosylase MltG, partial [Gemmatimonadota bacterium]|nr:endolytic transglycosylase MltG [Gemmatimonadota bacterium]